MHILSDFDGVWTDQAGEAAAIQATYAREAAKLLGIPEDEAWADFQAFRQATLADPAAHGWWPRGFLTAFVDEDELLATGAVSYWLDEHGDHPAAERWLGAMVKAGYENAQDFGNRQFGPAMLAYRAEGTHRLVDEARDVVEGVRARGDTLVIVSNSPTEKLRAMFEEAGLPEAEDLRFRGDARKWWIDEPEPRPEYAGRQVHLHRPIYEEVLLEQDPDVIIGDVASLDLAMGAAMRASGALKPGLRLLLRGHDAMSSWAAEQPQLPRDERLVDEVVDSITALVEG